MNSFDFSSEERLYSWTPVAIKNIASLLYSALTGYGRFEIVAKQETAVALSVDVIPNRSSRPAILLREAWREGTRIRRRTVANLSRMPP
ncbi:MAG: hypothetical protein OXI87_10415, partial [Albidovulum sp.]|nr:hypothetical protein [Albidovulum sp.]